MNTDAHGVGIRGVLPISVLICVYLWSISGCASSDKKPTTQPSSMAQRQNDALRDPFGYKPDMNRDVSGGDIDHLDRDGLKKDLNNVLNP